MVHSWGRPSKSADRRSSKTQLDIVSPWGLSTTTLTSRKHSTDLMRSFGCFLEARLTFFELLFLQTWHARLEMFETWFKGGQWQWVLRTCQTCWSEMSIQLSLNSEQTCNYKAKHVGCNESYLCFAYIMLKHVVADWHCRFWGLFKQWTFCAAMYGEPSLHLRNELYELYDSLSHFSHKISQNVPKVQRKHDVSRLRRWQRKRGQGQWAMIHDEPLHKAKRSCKCLLLP